MRKPSIVAAIAVAAGILGFAAHAEFGVYTDDFNRASIGSDWSPTASWTTTGGVLTGGSNTYFQPVTSLNDTYVVETDFYSTENPAVQGHYFGVQLNYTDNSNRYQLRYDYRPSGSDVMQLTVNVGGSLVDVENYLVSAGTMVPERWYNLRVESSEPGVFEFLVTDTTDLSVIFDETYSNTTPGEFLTGGQVGYLGGQYAQFDNFRLENIPEPASLALFLLGAGFLCGRRYCSRR